MANVEATLKHFSLAFTAFEIFTLKIGDLEIVGQKVMIMILKFQMFDLERLRQGHRVERS